MRKLINIILLTMSTMPALAQNNFKNTQLRFERVSKAYAEKGEDLQKALRKAGFTTTFELYIAAFKAEGKLELWLRGASNSRFELFRTYNFCKNSGTLGPKVREGDGQTPEGFYKINVFNPQSSFHLSLGIDYPNKVDVARTGRGNKPGGEIYIHGDCVTIGCIPLTDDKIKEVYLIATEARHNGQKEIPVAIFPFRLTAANFKKYSAQFPAQQKFWQTLQQGYSFFEKHRSLPEIKQQNGEYILAGG